MKLDTISRTCKPIDIEALLKYIVDRIISGGTNGADTYVRVFAQKHNLKQVEFLHDYEKFRRECAAY